MESMQESTFQSVDMGTFLQTKILVPSLAFDVSVVVVVNVFADVMAVVLTDVADEVVDETGEKTEADEDCTDEEEFDDFIDDEIFGDCIKKLCLNGLLPGEVGPSKVSSGVEHRERSDSDRDFRLFVQNMSKH
ncbi:hypothetical protein HELRODRAFT_159153 [Helobdella robusta]|uniref:Uncharacterized protein n=1 Tax=Helobdella robusta TaxID=6412 RepID=T1ENN8_HELRO|nr:hypothetical protein HELRODRAFT_159153 [Helobdella robusta]ESO12592.1 hypothetical protein HELRODRAFT_159153 [Helobdella robusta]